MTMTRIPATAGRFARPLGIALVAWGLLGLVLIGLVGVSIEPALATADALAENGTAADLEAALNTTVASLGGVGISVLEGRRAAEDAGTAVREIAATTDQLAEAMSLSIFGAQPFLSIAQGFERQTTSLEQLARDLDDLTAALRRNASDVAALQASALVLRDRVHSIMPASSAPASDLRPLIYALLAWLALPALAAIGAGAWLLRSAPLLPAQRRQAA
jgi:hypothetical protein